MEQSGMMNILMIEDNPADAQRIRSILNSRDDMGINIGYANKLSSGLKRIDREDFDVLLLDLNLSDSRGLNTLKKTKKKTKDLPIIVMSEKKDERMSKKAKEEGAYEYISKQGLNSSKLMQTINYAVKKKHFKEYKKKKESKKEEKDEQRILLISPDKFSLKLLKHIVDQEHDVIGYINDVEEGIQKITEKKPDLVILDIDGMDVENITKIRNLDNNSNMMLVGTDVPKKIKKRFQAAGYMRKPLKKEKLLDEIDMLC